MVGTRPMDAPRPRIPARRPRSSAIPASTSTIGEFPFTNIIREGRDRARDCFGKIRVFSGERRLGSSAQAQDVMSHEDLAIATGPGADADHRYAQFACGGASQLGRNAFE